MLNNLANLPLVEGRAQSTIQARNQPTPYAERRARHIEFIRALAAMKALERAMWADLRGAPIAS